VLWQGKRDPYREVKLKVLDYLIRLDLPGERFESMLRSRLEQLDDSQEVARSICAEILTAWESRFYDDASWQGRG
jgi:hypothetical protein